MRRKGNSRQRSDVTFITFGIATIVAVTAGAIAEDLRYFAEGSPDSFLQSWCIQPISIFVASLVFAATLCVLQFLNDRRHTLNYAWPYLPLLIVSAVDLGAQLRPLWIGVVALVCIACSVWQVHSLRGS